MIDFERHTAQEIKEAVDTYIIGRNAQRNRMIILRRLIDGITYESLAAEFEMSDRQIKRIVYKAVDKLSRKMR